MAKISTQQQDNMPASDFAFPEKRKEPLVDAEHVRNAIARFDQVEDVTNSERDEAWKRIKAAANRFGIQLKENDWRELFRRSGRSVPND